MNTQNLATLAPEARAAQLLSFDETKAELTALAKSSERITQITNRAGRDECHSSLMVLKGRRVDIEKRGKEARDDANKFAKAVIAKEKELIGFIAPEEERLQILRDQWDTAIEVARLEKLEAERLRVEAIQQKIQAIRDVPASLVGKPSVIIAGQLAKLEAEQLDEDEFAEFFVTARDALELAIARVKQQHADQVAHEAEQKRIAAEREELARMREENERLQREAQERAAADARRERERADSILARIDGIAAMARNLDGYSAAELMETRSALITMHPDTSSVDFAEFQDQALEAWDTAEATLSQTMERREQQEEAARQRAAEEQARRKEEDRRRQEEEARLQAERERQAAENQRLTDERIKLEKERQAAAIEAERVRLSNIGLREAAEAAVAWFVDEGRDDEQVCTDLRFALSNDENRTATARTVNRGKKVASA